MPTPTLRSRHRFARSAPFVASVALFGAACGGSSPPVAVPAAPIQNDDAPAAALPIDDALSGDAAGACGPFEALGALVPQAALAGRISIGLPADAVSSARPHDIMSAPTGDDAETRFVLDRGDSRLVVFVAETFASPPPDLASTVATLESARVQAGRVARVRLASGLEAAFVEPTSLDGPPGGVLVENAWVAMPDGTVVSIGIYGTPDVVTAPTVCRRVARTLLASITAGTARLDTSARERELSDGVHVTLPAHYAMTHDRGPDFDVYRLRPIVPLGVDAPVLGIYLGDHPDFEPEGDESPGTLFGQPASWWTVTAPTAARRQALVQVPGRELFAHVFMEARDGAELDALTRVAATLRGDR